MLAIEPVAGLTIDLAAVQGVLVTSQNGANALAAATKRRDVPTLAVGQATADILRQGGFHPVEAAEGDSDALVALAKKTFAAAKGRLVHVSGDHVAGSVDDDLRAAGFRVDRVIAYRSVAATRLSPDVLDKISQRRLDGVVLLSVRTATTFAAVLAASGAAEAARHLDAICISPTVAAACSALPWRQVRIALRTDLEGVLDLVGTAPAGSPR